MIPMVWYTLEQLTDYCCSENVVFGTVIATSSQQDAALFIIIGFDSSESLWCTWQGSYPSQFELISSIRLHETLANAFQKSESFPVSSVSSLLLPLTLPTIKYPYWPENSSFYTVMDSLPTETLVGRITES